MSSDLRLHRRTRTVFVASCFAAMMATCGHVEPPSVANGQSPEPARDSAGLEHGQVFAVDLFKHSGERGNTVISPTSLEAALALTALGAEGKTAQALATTLRFKEPMVPHKQLSKRLQRLVPPASAGKAPSRGDDSPAGDLRLAVALWTSSSYPLRPDFVTAAGDRYDAALQSLDFGRPTEAAEAVNRWAQDRTEGMITDLLAPEALQPMTRLVLTSAVYFHGRWAVAFDPAETKVAAFHLGDRRTVSTPLMHRKGTYNYTETDRYQAVELCYTDDSVSLFVLLPNARTELAAFEQSLTADMLQDCWSKLRPRSVDLHLPRCRIHTGGSLRAPLESLGLANAFSDEADFSGISAQEGLKLTDVVQQATIEWDETGTIAAAATAAVVGSKSLTVPDMPQPFHADRPFLFVLRHRLTGAILFLGRMVAPEPAAGDGGKPGADTGPAIPRSAGEKPR